MADPLHLEEEVVAAKRRRRQHSEDLLVVIASPKATTIQSNDHHHHHNSRLSCCGCRRKYLTAKTGRTNDVIHSSIEICSVTKALMDSRPMQRLRNIQQLATAEYVYINSTHSRFEHSLGVAHLAERMAKRIMTRQPNLKTTAKDVLCVKLAGLLHDVGHGPFSHTYEDFVHKILPEHLQQHPELEQYYEGLPALPDKNWKHENVSLMLIDGALREMGLQIDVNKLDEPLQEIGDDDDHHHHDHYHHHHHHSNYIAATSMRVFDKDLVDHQAVLTSRDFIFIKECIWGGPLDGAQQTFVGRPEPHQEWLYDIVSNRHSGLDVDKIDYFARDHRSAFKGSGEIEKLAVEEAVVAWGDCTDPTKCFRCQHQQQQQQMLANNNNAKTNQTKHLMICYPEKVVGSAMTFFKLRHTLHKTVYRHKKTDAVGYMICDIMCAADPYFRLVVPPELNETSAAAAAATTTATIGQSTKQLPISRAMLDGEVFLRLKDSIVDLIANTSDERLRTARDIIHRLERGDLYKMVATKKIDMKNESDKKLWALDDATIMDQMVAVKGNHGGLTLELDDFIVEHCSIHCGKGQDNPLNCMRFLKREQMSKLDAALLEDLPEANVEDETNYEADIPRSFEENSIRVFCKQSSKCELVGHVFNQWLEETQGAHSGIQTGMEEEDLAARGQSGGVASSVTPPPKFSSVLASQVGFSDSV